MMALLKVKITRFLARVGLCESHLNLASLLCHRFARQDVKSNRPIWPLRGIMMKTRAAVAVAAGQPLEIMEVDLDGPRQGEVLVEIMATGICHTDEFTLSGADPEGMFHHSRP